MISRGHIFRCSTIAALVLAASGAHALALEDQPPVDVGIEQKLDETIPLDLEFNDELGRPVKLSQVFGEKPVVLSLVYYECPMLCTQVLNGLLRSLKVLSLDVGEDFEVITLSIDPAETHQLAKAKRREYTIRYDRDGAEDGWHFLTGAEDQIAALADAVGFRYEYDPETDLYIHASGIMVLTPQGKLARYFYGIEYAPKDMRLGLVEASQNKIGSPVDQLLLLCYQYDPATGKYGFVIMNSIRVGGFLTVAALAAFVTIMIRRERRGDLNVPSSKLL